MIFNKLPTILQLRRLFQMYSYTLWRTHGEATNLRNKNASLSLRTSMCAHIFRWDSKGRRSILKVSSEQQEEVESPGRSKQQHIVKCALGCLPLALLSPYCHSKLRSHPTGDRVVKFRSKEG